MISSQLMNMLPHNINTLGTQALVSHLGHLNITLYGVYLCLVSILLQHHALLHAHIYCRCGLVEIPSCRENTKSEGVIESKSGSLSKLLSAQKDS